MSESHRVLVTGSAGRIGRAVVKALKASAYSVRGLDVVVTPNVDDFLVGNINDSQVVRRAMEGVTTLIHLAATPDDADFVSSLLPNNILGVYEILEAARRAGVKRLILGSSGQVTNWQRIRGPWPVRVTDPPTPRAWYAATKMFLEAAGRSFAEQYEISVIVARLGWCPRDANHVRELAATDWGPDVYLSPGDAGRFCISAVEAPAYVRFAVVFATSLPSRVTLYDLNPARDILGYEAQDKWPRGCEEGL